MNAKQATSKLRLPIVWVLSGCALALLAATALYLGTGAGSAVRAQASRQSSGAGRLLPVSARLANVPASPAGQQLRKTSGPAVNAFDRLPLAFDANQGQTDPQVKYLARGRGYRLFLTSNKAVLSMSMPTASPIKDALFRRSMGLTRWAEVKRERERAASTQMAALSMEMVGANPNPRVVAQNRLPGVTNYYIGNDPSKWRTGVPQYGRVAYEQVYPGVDLAFHGQQRQLEFDFLVAPGANPAPIALRFTGAKSIALDDSGNVVLNSAAGNVTMNKPVAYQEANGARQLVEARFVVKNNNQVGLALGNYDRSRELVIDPALNYATYLGGSGEDESLGIALDSSANSYVTGDTDSANFPSAGGATNGGSFDIFVTKLKADGSAIVYTTLVGGSGTDSGFAIAVDAPGNAFVAGDTTSTDFPVSGNAAQSTYGGGASDGVVVELNSSGARVYSTYLGGSGADDAFAIALDSASNAYVGGETGSSSILASGTVNGSLNQGSNAFPGAFDGFVAKIDTATTGAMAYFTYVGGSNDDLISGIALDAPANIVVTGSTISTDFPVTAGAFQTTCGTDGNCNTSGGVAESDAFLTKIGSGTGALPPVASTYLGGSDSDGGVAVAADSSGNAYITGFTFSGDFKTQNPFQTQNLTPSGSFTAFVTKVNSTATALTFSSYLGGSNAEVGNSIVIDQQSPPNLYLTGTTLSTDFPSVDPFQTAFGGGNADAFVTEVDGSGASMVYSSFFGGSGDENFENPAAVGGSIAVVTATVGTITTGTAYLSGITNSASGLAKNALQSTFAGSGTCGTAPNTFPCTDAFVAQVSAASGTTSPDFSVNISPTSATVTAGQTTSSIGVTVTSLSNFTGTVTLACSNLPAQSKCTFGSTSLPVAPGTGGATTVTVSTTAASSARLTNGRSNFTYALWLPIAGMALFGAGFPARRKKSWLLLGCLLLAAIIALPGCSSSSSGGGGGGGGGGTPPGNYTIGVTGTSGGTTHTASLFLTVQ